VKIYSCPALSQRAASLFFVLAFAITWVVWVPRALGAEWAVNLGYAWSYGPALAAVAAAAIVGRSELGRLRRALTTWRIGWQWYLVILFGPMALALVESLLLTVFSDTPFSENLPSPLTEPLAATVILLLILTITDGLGEELGWRGFAIPHMLQRTTAVVASLVLGVLWAAWHLPLFWTAGASLEGSSVAVLFARLPAAAVVYTWLLQHTKGSILAAALFHGTLNLFTRPPAPAGTEVTAALISTMLWWLIALALILAAGARRLDGWPGVRSADYERV
jgi:uncharacterized protein